MRDRIVAITDTVSREVSFPLAIGALRASEAKQDWQADVLQAFDLGERAILSGDFTDFAFVAKRMGTLGKNHPYARCGLLLHWKQALAIDPEPDHLFMFNLAHVVIDETIDSTSLKIIKARWDAHWVWLPKTGFPWRNWIAETLLPSKTGLLKVLTPRDEHSSFLSADELRVFISEFSMEHPLIHFESVPHEWHIPSELGPWLREDRSSVEPKITHDSRRQEDYPRSVVVPFLWTNNAEDLERLRECLRCVSVLQTERLPCEIILAVDRIQGAPQVQLTDIFPSAPNVLDFVVLDLHRVSQREDWRAGFVRNHGARIGRNESGHFLFVDSDVAVRESEILADVLAPDSFDLIQVANTLKVGFESATSSLLAIRSSLFRTLGGFSEAFRSYGCEDNFLVWQVEKANGVIGRLDRNTFEHLRPATDRDDVAAKMARLQPSANLMYRMTLDRKVHRHFYSSLGESVWSRALTKRLYSHAVSRFLFGALLVFMTLFETENLKKYLTGFYDVAIWNLKHPLLWLKSQSWKAQTPWHFVKKNAWHIPHTLMILPRALRTLAGHSKVSAQVGWIKVREARFGWNLIGWRLRMLGELPGRIRPFFEKIYYFFKHCFQSCLYFFRDCFHFFRHHLTMIAIRVAAIWQLVKWRPAVWLQRAVGSLNRIWTVFILVPFRNAAARPGIFLRSQAWRIPHAKAHLIAYRGRAQAALHAGSRFFNGPTEWFRNQTPLFYKWVWRPIMKTRYFLGYHLIERWRKT